MTTANLTPARKLLLNLAMLSMPGIGLAVPNDDEPALQNPHETPEAPADAVEASTAVEAPEAPVETIEAPAEYAEVFPSPAAALLARLVHKAINHEAMDAEETKEFLKYLDDQAHADAVKEFDAQRQADEAARKEYWEQEDAKAVQENLQENLEHKMRLEAALEQGEIEIHIRIPFDVSGLANTLKMVGTALIQTGMQGLRHPLF